MKELSALIQQVTEKSKLMKVDLIEKTSEIERLQKELEKLRSEKAESERKVDELKREIARATMVQHSNQPDGGLNERIDELVREIDECIHHLKQ